MQHPTLDRLKAEANSAIDAFLERWPKGSADGLYDPIHYLMSIGGKRLRAVLALSAAEAEGHDAQLAHPAALAVELFHNFTLMHDDIMDQAPKRRGNATVHMKWDENAAILSGDAMYTLAQIALADTSSKDLPRALTIFNQTALEVCIGQQSDMDFERRDDVTVEAYMEMIRLKTSVLVAASLALGAIAVGASEERVRLWYEAGEQLGLAFQMQDDLLDAFGGDAMGKQIGGDILSNKKTFLRLHTWEQANSDMLGALKQWDEITDQPQEKVDFVKSAMVACGADAAARLRMNEHVDRAMSALDALDLDPSHREWFGFLGGLVTQRTS
ncbi:polyprenyl synthetase family protein [Flavobacteriales bacterium]|nr:polyprenyl synthetase family protein [Flavobacteriales bacterium]